ncbi:MAG: Rrf2 family transcriptional regulator [Polyangiaceae bacterium]
MKRDSRLSVALHALLHMAQVQRLTSEQMAEQAGTNAVVIRRTMAGLRAAGIVRSEKGHGGGWSLGRGLDQVTLYDVYEALGEPTILAMENRSESPGCVVEKAVNHALAHAFEEARAVLTQRLRGVTLQALAHEVGPRFRYGKPHHRASHHGKAAPHV